MPANNDATDSYDYESQDCEHLWSSRRRIAYGRTAMTVRRLISTHIVVCRASEGKWHR